MKRDVQGVLLVLLGGAVLRLAWGDVYLRYVKEGMRPWLLVSGAVLVVLGALLLVDVVRAARDDHRGRDHDHDHDHDDADPEHDVDAEHVMAPDLADVDAFDDGHGHGPGGPRTAWLLLLPVLAIFLVAPPALGAYTAERQASTVVAPADPQAPPLPPGDPVVVQLADYAARAVWDDGRTLAGRRVQMTGFVTPAPGGGWYLTRMMLTCCAADAVTTKVKPLDVGPLPANTWVTVTGTWVPGGGTQRDDAVPWLKVDKLEQVPAPRNPYE